MTCTSGPTIRALSEAQTSLGRPSRPSKLPGHKGRSRSTLPRELLSSTSTLSGSLSAKVQRADTTMIERRHLFRKLPRLALNSFLGLGLASVPVVFRSAIYRSGVPYQLATDPFHSILQKASSELWVRSILHIPLPYSKHEGARGLYNERRGTKIIASSSSVSSSSAARPINSCRIRHHRIYYCVRIPKEMTIPQLDIESVAIYQ